MKKIINSILGLCALALLFICVRSILDTMNFDAEVAAREDVVKARLLEIRSAEEAYKLRRGGEYCADWNVLIDFVKNDSLAQVLKQGVLTDAQMDKGLTEASAAAIVNSGDTISISLPDETRQTIKKLKTELIALVFMLFQNCKIS